MSLALGLVLTAFAGSAIGADPTPADQAAEIAVALPLTGDEAEYGQGTLQGVQLAIEEANSESTSRQIGLAIYDDRGSDDGAKEVAGRIVASRATVVVGPTFSTASLAAGPVYAAAGLPALTPTATADLITKNRTTFRVIFTNSEQGETLALYLSRVLGKKRAALVVVDNAYGQSLQLGFQIAASSLGIETQSFVFKTPEEAEQIAQKIASDPSRPPVVFLTLDGDASRILATLRRLGVTGPFLGGDALGDEVFSRRFSELPEERQQPGYFTDGVYGIAPMILDSANAETLAFAERFRARFDHDPVWQATSAYDSARLAIATVRASAGAGSGATVQALRAAALDFVKSLNAPVRALPGLLGPLWSAAAGGRQQAIRIGRFIHDRFESAPVQIVPVTTPDIAELAAGSVFEVEAHRYARLQRVVYTGVYVNEIPRVDLPQSSFSADFYMWLRFASDAGPGAADPSDISFPNMISGSFDRAHPAETGELADGTVYRLWRVQGTFRNDFDLHRFPFDKQILSLPFFNSRAAADRIVYVLDKRGSTSARSGAAIPAPPVSSGGAAAAELAPIAPPAVSQPIVATTAFRNLTQWDPLATRERRENLVTDSGLGDPRRVGVESYRELSGFLVAIDLHRRTIATLAKTLMPLLLMTLIMFASLYFPVALVKEKVTVAITGALSGAVLLTAINSQLGSIGYTIAVEYAFYVFFGLSTLCIVSVLGAERLRAAGRANTAVVTDHWTRALFLLSVAGTLIGAAVMMWGH